MCNLVLFTSYCRDDIPLQNISLQNQNLVFERHVTCGAIYNNSNSKYAEPGSSIGKLHKLLHPPTFSQNQLVSLVTPCLDLGSLNIEIILMLK